MKKLVAIMVMAMMVFAMAACSSKGGSDAVAKFVKENEAELISSMEASFSQAAGMTCESSIKAEGNGFVININIQEMDNVDETVKTALQQTYDALQSTFDGMLKDIQKDLPELEYFTMNVCEKDGDVLATIKAGK